MTRRPNRWTPLVLAASLLVAACGTSGEVGDAAVDSPRPVAPSPSMPPAAPATAPPPTTGPAAGPSSTPVDGAASPATTANPAAEALATRPWATATLTDVATGEAFTIAELAGRPLFIEAMAIWCTNCRQQQARFTEAFAQLPPGTAEYVVLTVEPSEGAGDLARYEQERGFTGRYAVAGRELSRALVEEFGPNIINPPTVPLVFVSPAGEVEFRTGPESVEEILERAGA